MSGTEVVGRGPGSRAEQALVEERAFAEVPEHTCERDVEHDLQRQGIPHLRIGRGRRWGRRHPLEKADDRQDPFDDGAPDKVDDMARDVAAFLAWVAEPKMEARKELGFQVMIYLIVLSGLLYVTKRKIWAKIDH